MFFLYMADIEYEQSISLAANVLRSVQHFFNGGVLNADGSLIALSTFADNAQAFKKTKKI